jgi:3-isopropylmalate/(R)-2-methylmalate dehydratase small subunit
MTKIATISGYGVPLRGNDIDTDRIIPARFLRCITFDGLGEHAFADDRQQAEGQHPFDLPEYQGANILVVNANFGCGSSREHAPQAIMRWGIQAIIGESFAEIFFGNCLANGILCATTEPAAVKQIQAQLQENPQTPITVDLAAGQVRCGDFTASLEIGAGARQMLMSGTWDSCGQLVQNIAEIHLTASKLPYLNWQTR